MTTTQNQSELTRLRVLSLRQQGMSLRAVAALLNAEGVPTIGGASHWWPSSVQWAAGESPRQRGTAAIRSSHRTPTAFLPINRTFGVEIEWDGGNARRNYNMVASRITANGVPAYPEHGYTHAIPTNGWRVMHDGSCSGEVVSPVLAGQAGLDTVKTVMQSMKAAGCGARQRASVHVHVGVLDFNAADITRLVRNLRHTEKALLAYVADSRLANQYAHGMTASEWNTLEARAHGGRLLPRNGEDASAPSGPRSARFRENGSGVSRYRRWNFNPVLVYGTIEFRAHGATMNHLKIRPWIAVCTALVEATKAGVEFTTEQNVGQMIEALVASGALSRKAATEFKRGVATRNATPSYTRQQVVGAYAAAA